MPKQADRRPGTLVSVDDALAREFESRLVESSTLAFRVAFGVLRQRQDAEDVAQEAYVRAHRSFRQLRDRDQFRAWLVRMTWRLAINRRRADQRRSARECIPMNPAVSSSAEDLVAANERAQRLWRAHRRIAGKASDGDRPRGNRWARHARRRAVAGGT